MSSRADRADPILTSLCEELKNRIVAGGDPLRECFRRFEEIHTGSTSRKKLSPTVLIEYTAEAALAYPEPLPLLLKAIEFMPVKHGPTSVLEGVLRLDRSEGRDRMLYGAVGLLTAPPSAELMSKLADGLKGDYPFLPGRVWEHNVSRNGDPQWCRIWSSLCQGVLHHLAGKSIQSIRNVVEGIVKAIENVNSPAAEELIPLVLFLLGREVGEDSGSLPARLLGTPAGQLAQSRIDTLAGRKGEPARPAGSRGEVTTNRVSSPGPALLPADFPAEPFMSIFRIWESLGACLLSSKDQKESVLKLEEMNRELKTRLDVLDQETTRQREELIRLQASLGREQEQVARLTQDRESLVLQAEEARKERDRFRQELDAAREAYDRLDGQAAHEKSSRRDQVLTDLVLALRQPCEETAEMLEMALRGEKGLGDVTRMWNRLDETLARFLGRDRLAPVVVTEP